MRPAFKFAKTSNTAGVRSSTSDPVDEHVTHSSCAVTITDLFMAAGKGSSEDRAGCCACTALTGDLDAAAAYRTICELVNGDGD